jgi:acyl-CoA thioester hydrolase
MVAPASNLLERFTRGGFRHFTPSPTRWGDCDMFGHINNVQFVRYYESGRLDYFRQVLDMETGSGPQQTLIIADIHVNFLKQINHPCALEVGSRISRLGNSSFDFEAAIFAPGENEPYSTARAACVWFDYQANRSMPIPDAARQTIRDFEGLDL